MNKQIKKQVKRLQLSKETLQALNEPDLKIAIGGQTGYSFCPDPATDYTCCLLN
jgi:hypothetical protein